MDRSHFISQLTFNEYIFYLLLSRDRNARYVPGKSHPGSVWGGPQDLPTWHLHADLTQTPTPPSSSRRPLPPLGPQYRMEINNSWLVIRAGSIEWLLMESRAE